MTQRTDGHDAKTPDIDLRAVLFAGNDFGGHPVRGADHRRALRVRLGYLCAETEIRYRRCQYDVNEFERPDVLSLTSPFRLSRTLSDLMSRWMTP